MNNSYRQTCNRDYDEARHHESEKNGERIRIAHTSPRLQMCSAHAEGKLGLTARDIDPQLWPIARLTAIGSLAGL